jgi:hypothetical protein
MNCHTLVDGDLRRAPGNSLLCLQTVSELLDDRRPHGGHHWDGCILGRGNPSRSIISSGSVRSSDAGISAPSIEKF